MINEEIDDSALDDLQELHTETDQVIVKTHTKINEALNGEIIKLEVGYVEVRLTTLPEMVADDMGLIHGGFIFSAADYAAMMAVNDPNVVLANANINFLFPTKVGETLFFYAKVVENRDNKKFKVEVHALNQDEKTIFEGIFACTVLNKHILDS